MMMFDSVFAIRKANRAARFHWFDTETLRYFGTVMGSEVFGGRLFVAGGFPGGVGNGGSFSWAVYAAHGDGDVALVGDARFPAEDAASALARTRAVAFDGTGSCPCVKCLHLPPVEG